MIDLLKRLKRAYKAFKLEDVADTVSHLPQNPMIVEKAYKGHIFKSNKTISDYELATTSERITIESLLNKMKRDILQNIPDEFFETTVYSQYGNQEIEVTLIVYKNE